MSTGHLTIDLDAIVANWRALDKLTQCATAAVVKADGYGLGAGRVAKALANAGARQFFVAVAEEGATLRQALGPGPEINVFSGHMRGDTDTIADLTLTPMLNSVEQVTRHFEALPGHAFGIQLDTGMNRLGMEWDEWAAIAPMALAQRPNLVMSHLACADEPGHHMNQSQLTQFRFTTLLQFFLNRYSGRHRIGINQLVEADGNVCCLFWKQPKVNGRRIIARRVTTG